ncbi:hypothetical protein DL546_002174 [Coniochaeta pulveracea]|uniref:Uncharacterized protein n=1 Tax=Coniochaeta pulveracea TaxID=177199 RepID=A0A420XYW2_9PEZI|nr:hypothetical protein DL546_002174 [Coniochaeta pulveracea]
MPKSRRGKPRTEQVRQAATGKTQSQRQHEAQGQLVKLSADCPQTQPVTSTDQPWSQWLPGDDGRWFYQGRLKADGSGWEYQFTEGYPPTSRRPVTDEIYSPGASLLRDSHGVLDGSPSAIVEQGHPEYAEVTVEGTVQDIGQSDAAALKPSIPALPLNPNIQPESQLQLVTLSSIPPRTRASKTGRDDSRGSGSSFRESLGRKKKKKLDSIVKSEKELKFNPRRSVKRWLDGVEP